MVRSLLLLLLVFSILACKAQTGKTDTTLKYLVYGDPKIEYLRAKDAVGRKYGFSVYAVASCMVSQELVDSSDKENKRVYDIMKRRFGKNWEIKFNKEVDTMMKLQAKVKTLVEKESYVIAKINELPKIFYLIEPVEYPNIFSVKAYSYGKGYGRVQFVTYFKLTANLATNMVTKESDVIELYEDPIFYKRHY